MRYIRELCCIFFLSGIFISYAVPAEYAAPVWPFALFILCSATAIIAGKNNPRYLYPALTGLFLFFGLFVAQKAHSDYVKNSLRPYFGSKAFIEGRVREVPRENEKGINFSFALEMINKKPIKADILVLSPSFPKHSLGESLGIKCRIYPPSNKDGGNFADYLELRGLSGSCHYPEIVYSEEAGINSFEGLANRARKAIGGILRRSVAGTESAVAIAMTLGDMSGIDKELSSDFSRSGLSHIMAISGMNITMIAVFCLNFCIAVGFDRKKSFFLSASLIWFYIFLIGYPSSAVRAGVMGFIVLLMPVIGRAYQMNRALLYSAVLMAFVNPRMLIGDIGFQFSFLATFGLIHIAPGIKEKISRLGRLTISSDYFKETIAVTASSLIMVTPLAYYHFGFVPLSALFTNLAVLWTVPPIFFGLFSGIVSTAISATIGRVVFLVPYYLIKFMVYVAKISVNIPFSYFYFEKSNLFVPIIAYLAVALIMIKKYFILAKR